MRKTIFILILIIPFFFAECTKQVNNPIVGVWDLQYSEWSTADTSFICERSETVREIKVFTKEHYMWALQNPENIASGQDPTSAGAGTYELLGDTLIELLIISPWLSENGKKIPAKVEIRGDTMIHVFPYPGYETDIWKEWTGKEIYVRLE